jgi:23S rRNA pseudouridine1911/1915/1917 synthase
LHAAGLTVTHPVTGQTVTITSPLPHEFAVALKYLRRFAGLAAA